MINLRRDVKKICETCKKECSDDYVFVSTANSKIVCLCSKDANKLAETCKQYGILFSIY